MLAALIQPIYAEEEDHGVSTADEHSLSDMTEVFQLLDKYHLHGVAGEALSAKAIEAMIELIDDPYTVYYTEEEWAAYEQRMERQYSGIGLRLAEDNNGFYVVEVFVDSPAEASGFHRGDYITAVDGQAVTDLTIDQLVDMIVGVAGTSVVLEVQRGTEALSIECIRADIQVPIVYSQRFSGDIGYIELQSFSETAAEQFITAKNALEADELKGLIIDLRGNPGGYLHIVNRIAQQFITEGVLIYEQDRHQVTEIIEIKGGQSVSYPVVVLVNENSASGAEIMAGALQDYGLATVIGTQTFGKGYVQSLISLSSGSMLKITVWEYLTPHQHPVHEAGITPDLEVAGHVMQLLAALHTLELPHVEMVITNHSLKINQVNVPGFIDYFFEDDQVFMHSRQLAAMIDAGIVWDGHERTVSIIKQEQANVFSVKSPDVRLLDGKTYISLDAFAKAFTDFQWSYDDEELKLSYGQRNE